VEDGEIRDGCVRVRHVAKLPNSHLNRSIALYQERMNAAGLVERPARQVLEARAHDEPTPACLLGVITTIRQDEPIAVEDGDAAAARSLLAALRQHPPTGPVVLYLYYAPDPGHQLTDMRAKVLFRSLLEEQQ
jgi:hypothetical protein